MDEINFACDKFFYFALFVFCEYAISVPSISDKGREKESHLGLLPWVLFGNIVYHDLTSPGNISF